MRRVLIIVAALMGLVRLSAAAPQSRAGAPTTVAPAPAPTRYSYRVVNVYPHDAQAFTQGLVFADGMLYESTGLTGRSSLRKVELTTGKVLAQRPIDAKYFAEGLTDWRGTLIQLTWQTGVAFSYDRRTLQPGRTFSYVGEGWGLTQDGQALILSDGSPAGVLKFINPATFQVTKRLTVRDRGTPVANMNELEFVKGEIYANIWHADRIARIAPASGAVVGWIDLDGLLPRGSVTDSEAVLNGIAYDAAGDRLFVTGKLWPKLYEIKVIAP